MFRIVKTTAPSDHRINGDAFPHFSRFCETDQWTGDLSNGIFQLGQLSEKMHGLESSECGLLTLLRCYDIIDRTNILELLEHASSEASSFCYSTHIIAGPNDRQPLLCIGESSGFGDKAAGLIYGVFIFPRLAAEPLIGH